MPTKTMIRWAIPLNAGNSSGFGSPPGASDARVAALTAHEGGSPTCISEIKYKSYRKGEKRDEGKIILDQWQNSLLPKHTSG
ncbi:hypothetical protein Cal7507_0713 [Calothrix sp. PCC 7507]|nr:hypothetical protein Cal7507_0713 [Calothrix sp. PCC 7507]